MNTSNPFRLTDEQINAMSHDCAKIRQVEKERQREKRCLAFRKVYKAPGYPVDPKLEQERTADLWMNSLSPQKTPRIFDYRSLRRFKEDNAN